MLTLNDCLKIETYWDEYKRKTNAYDVQIDKEWAPFLDVVEWTDELVEKACVIAERQGKKQQRMFEAYERKIRG